MDRLPDEAPLSDYRNATLVVRIVLDRWGRLVQGEVLEVGHAGGRRFMGWDELIDLIRNWLASQEQAPHDPA